ncbi:MAG: autoinducer binding domain-containing protein [Amaricoccus sp.]|uniref:autoinducer binding domain-containing protein n=1 Tax=Amaricoccus sp. TaxID=1872485 RepID=UPI0033145DD5
MIGWVEASLYEAINCLARVGKNELATDLTRLLETLDFEELEVFRDPASEVIADQLLEVSTFPDLVDLLRQFSEAIGVAHCTLHVVSELPSIAFTTRALTTYPEEWVTRYFNRRYINIDPVQTAAATAESGFFWDTLQVTDPNVRAFYHDAKSRGIGPSGYTLPIMTERGDKIAISVSSPEDRERFRDRIGHVEQDLVTVGYCITEAFSRLASEDRPTDFTLTDDQMVILRAVAMGLDEAEMRSQSYIYGSYATLERSICSLFRTRTVAQAAIVAARVGLLTNAPLTKADILIGSSRVPANRVVTTPNATSMRRLIRMRNVMPGESEPQDEASPDWHRAFT